MTPLNNTGLLQTGVLALMAATFPHARHVEAHGGQFGAAELERLRRQTPAVEMGAPTLINITAQNGVTTGLAKCVMILTAGYVKDKKLEPFEAAQIMAVAAAQALVAATFGEGIYPITEVTAQPFYTIEDERARVAIQVLSWSQTIVLATEDNEAEFKELFYSWSPKIGMAHEADYRPLAGGQS